VGVVFVEFALYVFILGASLGRRALLVHHKRGGTGEAWNWNFGQARADFGGERAPAIRACSSRGERAAP
jgi:hypothetical protein